MKNGFHAIDSDLHVIEMGEVYEKYLDDKYRDKMPRYLNQSTKATVFNVKGPWYVRQ